MRQATADDRAMREVNEVSIHIMKVNVGPTRIDHTAVVVSDMDEAIQRWKTITGGQVSIREIVPDQRVEIAMLRVGDTMIELIRPVDSESGVSRFLEKRGESLHHVGLAVRDIVAAINEMKGRGFEFVDDEPRPSPEGLITFIHPRSTGGLLLELVQREK